MAGESIVVQIGLPTHYALPAAEIYYEAFGAKMRPLIGSPERGTAVLQPDLQLGNALGALDGDRLIGLAGLRFADRRFWRPRVATVVRQFGWLGGLPRAALLLLIAAGGRHAGMLYIEALAVRSDWRGRGIGTMLIEAAFAFARERGLAAAGLDVVDTNPAARRLYERMGFVAVKTRRMPFARSAGFTAITEMAKQLP